MKHLRKFARDRFGLSNIIVIVLSLVILVIVVSNVILWSYEMNQLDWEKMKENITIVNVTSATNKAWMYNPSGYSLRGSTSWMSGSLSNLASDDSAYMTFRSYNSKDVLDLVDTNVSNVDSFPDAGTHDEFSAQQTGPDLVYDTLVEENVRVYRNETRYMTSSQLTVNGLTAYGLNMTQTDSHIETSSSRIAPRTASWGIRVWKRNAAGSETEITGGNKVATVSRSSDGEGVQSNTWNCPQTPIEASDALVIRIYVDLLAGDVLLEQFTTEQLGTVQLDSATWKLYYWTKRSFSVGTTYSYFGYGDSAHNSRIQNLNHRTETSYQLDLEVQWNDVDFDEANEELCLYGGTMDAEDIQVDVWNGLTWQNVFPDLSAGWNNVSVSPYLTASNFTIRFKGGTETSDFNQDNWNVDVALLHVWSDEYASEVEFTGSSNVQDWIQLNWIVNSGWTIGSVNVTIQLYDYSAEAYATGGEGFLSYASSATSNTYESRNQTVNFNTTRFRSATGTWRIKVKGVKDTDSQFDFKADWIEFSVLTKGTVFTFKNEGAPTAHLVSLWVNNSTQHQRLDISLFVNYGDTAFYYRSDINLPNKPYVVKVVTERGNIAVFSEN